MKISGEFGENPKLSCNRNGSFCIARLSQRDTKAKNEAGVPLVFEIRKDLRGMDRIFPITFIVEILIYLAFLINEVAA